MIIAPQYLNLELTEVASEFTEIFPAYEEFLQPARFKVAYGGRGSAKTRTFVSILLNNVMYHGWRVACFREIMKSIEDSVYQEFVDEIYRKNLQGFFKIIKNSIVCSISGGIIKFDGLLRNQQKLKGYAGFHCAWVEEAENVSADSWKYLIPTLRLGGSEIWVSFNPDDALSATYQMFVANRRYPDYVDGKRYCIVKKINYTDNPRFPEELRIDMELMKENDFEMYQHVYLGECVGNSALAIIKPMWIKAAIDAHKELYRRFGVKHTGGLIGGFDVADEGADANAFVGRKGFLTEVATEWKDQDPNTAARRVFNNCLNDGYDYVSYDNIGVGTDAKGAIREEVNKLAENQPKKKRPQFRGFVANASVVSPLQEYSEGKKNEDMFLNLKAQAWWLVADRFKNTYVGQQGKPFNKDKLIAIDSNCDKLDKLTAELSQPRREFKDGKFSVESKKDMAKRGVVSPNLADAYIMAYAPENGFKLENLI